MKEIGLGLLASMFFAVTFVLNRSMELAGGSWVWSSSLRFLFMVPFLLIIVLFRKNLKEVLNEMKKQPLPWLVWSFVGFVLFYAPITYAAAYGPGWLIAGTWQLTIVAGVLLGPIFFEKIQTKHGLMKVRHKLQWKALFISLLILLGVMLIQMQQANQVPIQMVIFGVLPVIIAAFAYPLGNRKMMELCGGRLDTFQRVFGMTIASLPFWFLISVYGIVKVGAPSSDQVLQSFIVAICSGVIATTLFFIATDKTRENQGKLAAVEATQSAQIIFVVIGEVVLLSSPLPNGLAVGGLLLIILGIFIHSFITKKTKVNRKQKLIVAAKRKEQHI
ncbi:drug/metabolite transporter (DMT)-like permease [Evansella vedderi]|uniref:Drug/metabolite transporter (DMT)-like permease n=1 Tax=Evansella vedderi TaxID=38282 RepID=A0ABT9ZUB7_9BACI|nr:multidrug resistance efflux transporter family protein [Evansella vedderi]MDQ0254837.1 drug/metabolite transporter (DMT)-like permease [Evansella vedderi]